STFSSQPYPSAIPFSRANHGASMCFQPLNVCTGWSKIGILPRGFHDLLLPAPSVIIQSRFSGPSVRAARLAITSSVRARLKLVPQLYTVKTRDMMVAPTVQGILRRSVGCGEKMGTGSGPHVAKYVGFKIPSLLNVKWPCDAAFRMH